jgi:hypothetical protein
MFEHPRRAPSGAPTSSTSPTTPRSPSPAGSRGGPERARQDHLPGDRVVVSDEIDLVLDLEAIHQGDLEKTGAIAYRDWRTCPGTPGIRTA